MSSALNVYALCVVVLFLKMIAVSGYQGFFRIRSRAFMNTEDAAFFNQIAREKELAQVTCATGVALHKLGSLRYLQGVKSVYSRFSVQRLSVGSIFKITFIGLATSLMPLGVLFGVLAAFGFDTVHYNGEPLHGVVGLAFGSLLGMLLTLMFSIFLGTLLTVGLWVYSTFCPLTLRGKELVNVSTGSAMPATK